MNYTSITQNVDGKIFLTGSVFPIKDARIISGFPDTNYGLEQSVRMAQIDQWMWGFFGNLMANKKLNLYIFSVLGTFGGTFKIYETDNDWIETDITWNNKPALGDLIEELSAPAVGWWQVSTGTTGSICIVGYNLSTDKYEILTYSKQYTTDETKRPYISNP
ncbi:MAG: hypothetical protein PHG61_07505 [Candidatus Marinimicrobia bacterium]|nr:hypothetical protein [Candidatus Neomarinimicrobiota bacterium]